MEAMLDSNQVSLLHNMSDGQDCRDRNADHNVDSLSAINHKLKQPDAVQMK